VYLYYLAAGGWVLLGAGLLLCLIYLISFEGIRVPAVGVTFTVLGAAALAVVYLR
jgi:hypothetical protein